MSLKSVVNVTGIPKPEGVWSTVVTAKPGKLVFISGLLAKNAAGTLVGLGDLTAQTRQVCENLKRAVEAAGGALADIVRVDVHVSDIGQFAAIHAVRREYFPSDPPASTMVEISRFTTEGAMIEMSAIAVI